MIDRRKFIKCSFATVSLSSLVFFGMHKFQNQEICFVNSDYKTQTAELKWGDIPHLTHFEIHATDHCNLNCKYCNHFSPVSKKWYYDIKNLDKDLERLSHVANKNVTEIQILGGEPLLHPQINSFFRITRKYFPYSRIDLLTNGTLLDSMPIVFWKSLNENKINICPSIYPVKIDWQDVLKKAKTYDVKVANDESRTPITTNNIDTYTVKKFKTKIIDLSGKQKLDKYYSCYKVKTCNNFKKGKLYPCHLISNIHILNEKYSINLPVTEDDYIDIYKVSKIEEIIDFMKKPKPFCKYCAICSDKSKQPSEPWECSLEHSLSEWTI